MTLISSGSMLSISDAETRQLHEAELAAKRSTGVVRKEAEDAELGARSGLTWQPTMLAAGRPCR